MRFLFRILNYISVSDQWMDTLPQIFMKNYVKIVHFVIQSLSINRSDRTIPIFPELKIVHWN